MANTTIAELIAANLESALHSKSVTYGGATRTTTCEREHMVLEINNRYPYIEVCGPWATVEGRDNRGTDTTLNFEVVLYDDTINDYGFGSEPVSKTAGDASGEMIRLIMASPQRGGYAIMTRYSNYGYAIDRENNRLAVYLSVEVQAWINVDNPYSLSA